MNPSKPNILLDLDGTLIYSLRKDKIKQQQFSWFNVKPMSTNSSVIERPHLQSFLDFVFKNFNVSIWTAAQEKYAMWIIKHFILIKHNRKLHYLLHNEHTKASMKLYNAPKDLRLIYEVLKLPHFNQYNTYIIDDLVQVCQFQKPQCLNVQPFEATDKNDNALLKVMQTLQIIYNTK